MSKTTLYSFNTPLRRRVTQPIGDEPSATVQSYKDDCDVNQIMSKYQRLNSITHFAKYSPQYGDFSPCDLQQAENMVLNAKKMFADLPSSVRELTRTPQGFLAFVQDPKNADKMRELGLVASPPSIAKPPATPSAGS